MENSRGRSILFPVLLILAGVALLLQQLGVWTLDWAAVANLWPVLLILIGLDILLRGSRVGVLVSVLVSIALVVVVVALIWPVIRTGGAVQAQSLSVPAAQLTSAAVHIVPGVAELVVSPIPANTNVLEARVEYRENRTQVTLQSDVRDGHAQVLLRSESHGGWVPIGPRTADRWEVQVGGEVPMEMLINLGVGTANVDLSTAHITQLDIQGGVGRVQVTLPAEGRYSASIDIGIGAVEIVVPPELAARIRVDEGLGTVTVDDRFRPDGQVRVSDDYEAAAHRVDLNVRGGIGSVTIR